MQIILAQKVNSCNSYCMEQPDQELLKYGVKYYSYFMTARISSAYKLLVIAAVINRMPRRSGPAFDKLYAQMEEGLDLVASTTEEVYA